MQVMKKKAAGELGRQPTLAKTARVGQPVLWRVIRKAEKRKSEKVLVSG
jgi:hypothetical protein